MQRNVFPSKLEACVKRHCALIEFFAGVAALKVFVALLVLPQVALADSWIYWTTAADTTGTLERALLDGTGHEVLISDQGRLIGLAIDSAGTPVL